MAVQVSNCFCDTVLNANSAAVTSVIYTDSEADLSENKNMCSVCGKICMVPVCHMPQTTDQVLLATLYKLF